MKKFKSFSKKKKIIVVAIAVALIVVLLFLIKGKNSSQETVIVNSGDFLSQVSVSGKVVPSESVDLGFKTGGVINRIYYSVGDNVKKGKIIANLDSSDALGALRTAQANYQKVLAGATSAEIDVAKAVVNTAQVALDKTKSQQDVLVANAYKNLLSIGLVPTLSDPLNSTTPPEITGYYTGNKEGKIIISGYNTSGSSGYFATSGLIEAVGQISINTPQPIGDSGLFIKYANSSDQNSWTVNIPNKESPLYLANYNAYQTAFSTRDQSVADAQAALDQAKSALILKQSSARPEDVSAAEGAVLSAKGAYDDKFIYAPFDGVITKMDSKVGEIATPSVSEIAMMSAGTFQIESFVPEVNIAQITQGAEAKITLDAYGPDVPFMAKVVSIDPAETIRDGVSTYRIKLQFENVDDRIKSGMTANVSVVVFDKQNTITIPEGVIFEKNGTKFVQVKKDKKIIEQAIQIGVTSSLGQVEILSGLLAGDQVILNPVVK